MTWAGVSEQGRLVNLLTHHETGGMHGRSEPRIREKDRLTPLLSHRKHPRRLLPRSTLSRDIIRLFLCVATGDRRAANDGLS